VILKGEGEGPYHAGPVYLWVAREDEDRARDVIDAIATGAYAMTDAEFEAQATGSASVTDEHPQR
jgi:hypothetical protein